MSVWEWDEILCEWHTQGNHFRRRRGWRRVQHGGDWQIYRSHRGHLALSVRASSAIHAESIAMTLPPYREFHRA